MELGPWALSGLEWLESVPGSRGWVLWVPRMDSYEVAADLVGILPAVVDRWRSEGSPFSAVLAATPWDARLAQIAEAGNAELAHAGGADWSPPGTGPVPVILRKP